MKHVKQFAHIARIWDYPSDQFVEVLQSLFSLVQRKIGERPIEVEQALEALNRLDFVIIDVDNMKSILSIKHLQVALSYFVEGHKKPVLYPDFDDLLFFNIINGSFWERYIGREKDIGQFMDIVRL